MKKSELKVSVIADIAKIILAIAVLLSVILR
jgi:hypothetical protein